MADEVIFTKSQSVEPIQIIELGSKKEKVHTSSEKEHSEDLRVSGEKIEGRAKTGIKGFDELIEGGFERESIVLLVGSAGTGKTLFGLQFLYEGVTQFNEPGVFISFEQDKESLYKHSLNFGWTFKEIEEQGKFKLLQFKPHQVTAILEGGDK